MAFGAEKRKRNRGMMREVMRETMMRDREESEITRKQVLKNRERRGGRGEGRRQGRAGQ